VEMYKSHNGCSQDSIYSSLLCHPHTLETTANLHLLSFALNLCITVGLNNYYLYLLGAVPNSIEG
jgi:hypothetical protein